MSRFIIDHKGADMRLHIFFVFSALLLAVSGCQSKVELETISIYNADEAQSLAINARRLEIVNNWLMPLEATYVEHELNPTPDD